MVDNSIKSRLLKALTVVNKEMKKFIQIYTENGDNFLKSVMMYLAERLEEFLKLRDYNHGVAQPLRIQIFMIYYITQNIIAYFLFFYRQNIEIDMNNTIRNFSTLYM